MAWTRAGDDGLELPSVREDLRRFFLPQLYAPPVTEEAKEEKVRSGSRTGQPPSFEMLDSQTRSWCWRATWCSVHCLT